MIHAPAPPVVTSDCDLLCGDPATRCIGRFSLCDRCGPQADPDTGRFVRPGHSRDPVKRAERIVRAAYEQL